jgi:hypothetical protein
MKENEVWEKGQCYPSVGLEIFTPDPEQLSFDEQISEEILANAPLSFQANSVATTPETAKIKRSSIFLQTLGRIAAQLRAVFSQKTNDNETIYTSVQENTAIQPAEPKDKETIAVDLENTKKQQIEQGGEKVSLAAEVDPAQPLEQISPINELLGLFARSCGNPFTINKGFLE